MPIDPKEIRVGHCYMASASQHRRVTAIVEGQVHFETWHDGASGPSETRNAAPAALDAFASAVESETPCPDVPRVRPSKAEG